MLLLLFCSCVEAKSPIILMPGIYGSNIHASYTKSPSKRWYCPKTLNQTLLWVNYNLLFPPFLDCFFELLRGYYNPKTDSVSSFPNSEYDVYDFGGVEGILYADKDGMMGKHNYISMVKLVERLKSHGYTVKKDLFGAPFDWRIAVVGIEKNYYPRLKALIEKASSLNNGQRVTMVGFSMGSLVIQRFLTVFVTQEWKDRFIKKVIYLAPAVAGSAASVEVMWSKKLDFMTQLESPSISDTIEASPSVHVLFPNHVAYGDIEIIRTPSGQKLTAKDVPQFMINQGKIKGDNMAMMRKSTEIISQRLEEINVPLYILYNSGIRTQFGLVFRENFNDPPNRTRTPGDGTVPSVGIEWICKNWKMDYPLVCQDFHSSDHSFRHGEMANNPYIQDLLYNITIFDDWTLDQRTEMIYSPHVEVNNFEEKYHVDNSIKAERRILIK